MGHVIGSQGHVLGHVMVSQGHVLESLSSLFGCSFALGLGWVDLGVSHVIPS